MSLVHALIKCSDFFSFLQVSTGGESYAHIRAAEDNTSGEIRLEDAKYPVTIDAGLEPF